jgi:hypothetical protein
MSVTTEERPAPVATIPQDRDVVRLRRRTLDKLLIGTGAVAAVVFAAAGGLLMWGSNFAEDYVHDELASQNVEFPDADSLREEGRDDLVKYADEQVTTGAEAEAYAGYIAGHLEGVADGATYADLGPVYFGAQAALEEAQASGTPSEIAEAQAALDEVTGQRDTLFKGDMLRGTLLNTYAWDTMGRIAGVAALVAFAGAAVMLVLVVAGWIHLRRMRHTHT